MLFGLGVFASLSVLTSCKKDEVLPEGPKISFANGASYSATESDTSHTIVVDVEAAGELKEIKLFDVSNENSENQIGATITKFNSDTKHTINHKIDLIGASGIIKLKVSVTDKKDQTNSSTFVLTTFSKAINSYDAVLVGGNLNYSGDFGCFYSSTNNLAYNLNNAKNNSELVDFIYAYGPTYKAHLAAPSDKVMVQGLAANLSTKNITTITKMALTSEQFDAISKDSELAKLTFGTDTYVKELNAGDVVAFKTVKGKIGLVKIVEIKPSTEGATDVEKYGKGTMKIQVKVQK